MFYASKEYIERQGVPDTAGEGEGHRIVAMDLADGQLADVPWLLQRLPRATYRFRSNSRDMQAVACAAGGGVSVLPRVLGGRFGLLEIWPDEPPPARDVWLGYHTDLRRVARLRAVIEHLRSTVPREV
ncbi:MULTISPECIES: LysR substrate-binding domain-containing protein [Rhizobium]|uniref:LysR substrate-binding domain-containing protein n=1 Tax=Rhizobium TaxID=379 RepID=UPI0035E3F580